MAFNYNRTGPRGRPGSLANVSNEFEYWILATIWLFYSCTGSWDWRQFTRPLILVVAVIKVLILRFTYHIYTYGLGLFLVFMHGRMSIDYKTAKGIAETVLLFCWLALDMLSMFFVEAMYGAIVMEGLLAMALALYVMVMVSHLQRGVRSSQIWILRTVKLVLWGMIWGILSLMLWLGLIDQIVLIAWFFTYSAYFTLPPRRIGSQGSLALPRSPIVNPNRATGAPTKTWRIGFSKHSTNSV